VLPEKTFIANEAHWFTLDVVYLVFVRSGVVAGARVGGQLGVGAVQISDDPTAYTKPDLLRRALEADPFAHGFLASDRRNFVHSIAELGEARLSARRALWTGPVPNSGSVTFIPRAGRKRRLILLGRQDLGVVRALLISEGVPVTPLAP
jgi:hypothetical protein